MMLSEFGIGGLLWSEISSLSHQNPRLQARSSYCLPVLGHGLKFPRHRVVARASGLVTRNGDQICFQPTPCLPTPSLLKQVPDLALGDPRNRISQIASDFQSQFRRTGFSCRKSNTSLICSQCYRLFSDSHAVTFELRLQVASELRLKSLRFGSLGKKKPNQ